MFQFKINHNIIYTKDKFIRANIIADDLCHLCKSEQHTIQHMFLKCSHDLQFYFGMNFLPGGRKSLVKTFSYQT